MVVYAETAGKARRMIANENDFRFIDVRVYRLPWADEYGDFDNIPIGVLFKNGWWFECNYCGKHITEIGDFYFTEEGYACKNCYESEANE